MLIRLTSSQPHHGAVFFSSLAAPVALNQALLHPLIDGVEVGVLNAVDLR